MLELDHLVVAARTLEEGAAWVEARLGVAPGPGGKHVTMGTHNRLLSLGPGRFLEVIAIDPDAPAPGRPRWFDLDTPAMRERLAGGPALVHWVARTDNIERALAALGGEVPPVLDLSRGDYRWRIGVPESGTLVHGGVLPTVIHWLGRRPAESLAPSGCRLDSLVLGHPQAPELLARLRHANLSEHDPIQARVGGLPLQAQISTPRGAARLPE